MHFRYIGEAISMQMVTVSGAQIVAGGAVAIGSVAIGANILCSKHDQGRLRYSDGRGINPQTQKEFDNLEDARKYMEQIKDKAEKRRWEQWLKSKGWKRNHVVKKPK